MLLLTFAYNFLGDATATTNRNCVAWQVKCNIYDTIDFFRTDLRQYHQLLVDARGESKPPAASVATQLHWNAKWCAVGHARADVKRKKRLFQ